MPGQSFYYTLLYLHIWKTLFEQIFSQAPHSRLPFTKANTSNCKILALAEAAAFLFIAFVCLPAFFIYFQCCFQTFHSPLSQVNNAASVGDVCAKSKGNLTHDI